MLELVNSQYCAIKNSAMRPNGPIVKVPNFFRLPDPKYAPLVTTIVMASEIIAVRMCPLDTADNKLPLRAD